MSNTASIKDFLFDLANNMAEETGEGVSLRKARQMTDAFTRTLCETMNGLRIERLMIPGLGTFKAVEQAPRVVAPAGIVTGKRVVLKFTPTRSLRVLAQLTPDERLPPKKEATK